MQVNNIQLRTKSYLPQNTTYHTKPLAYDSVSFSANNYSDKQYTKAQNYANRKKLLNFLYPLNLSNYNLDKLDGIQKGLKTFENLTMKEIAYIFENLHIIMLKRGCSNQCLHCYVNAKPEQKENNQFINRMPYEDFINFTDDLKKLKNRIGITIPYNTIHTSMFYDADCMEISLFDKNGVEHDFTEIHEKFYDAFKTETIFDTAGWNHKNPKMQARAEKYIKYLTDLNNQNKFYQINLSLSPFNPIYARALELGYNPRDYGKSENSNTDEKIMKGEKLYKVYIDRMANMLYTFTPLLGDKNFSIISRPVDKNIPNMEDFTFENFGLIKKHILMKLESMYTSDMHNEQKFVKNKDTINFYINKYSNLLGESPDIDILPAGRFKELFMKKNPEVTEEMFEQRFDIIQSLNEEYENLKRTKDLGAIKYEKVINTDGRLYLFDLLHSIPTEIQLNLSTKDKTTPKLYPEPEKDFLITKDMIKKAGK